MENRQYSSLSYVYDSLNSDFDYDGYAKYLDISSLMIYHKTEDNKCIDIEI